MEKMENEVRNWGSPHWDGDEDKTLSHHDHTEGGSWEEVYKKCDKGKCQMAPQMKGKLNLLNDLVYEFSIAP